MFKLISDCHFEHKQFNLDIAYDDSILIIAGDMSAGKDAHNILKVISTKFKHIIYIPGNHEYYGNSIRHLNKMISNHSIPNLTTIDSNGHIDCIVYGKRIVGCVGWGSLNNNQYVIQNTINDFKKIIIDEQSDYVGITDILEKHNQDIAFLNNALKTPCDIVVTHHVPCNFLVRPEFQTSNLQSAYVMNVDTELFNNSEVLLPEYWVFGHTHDYIVQDSFDIKFRCNPVGYISNDFVPIII
jgi:predicted phosphohydrolase